MARLPNLPQISSPSNGRSFDRSSAELGQLLSRLQRTVLHADPERERRLRRSQFERARLGTNLEYARNSLSKLEHDAASILAPVRRVEVQADLSRKRELLEMLMDKLQDLHKIAVDDDDDDDDSSEGEDILSEIIPTPSESMGSTNTERGVDTPSETSHAEPAAPESATPAEQPTSSPTPPPPPSEQEPSAQAGPTQTTQSLRSRKEDTSSPPPYATARAQLFANRRRPGHAEPTAETTTATAEAIMDRQAAEREDLADKVFRMAQAMKRQQQSIASSLESEKDVLGLATEGMERTGRGMEATRGRMGMLTRMTEGKGWWGRMILFAWVYGLMVALMVLVFVMPKLRF